MKKKKLILFDWGNIVESYSTGYNIYNAYEDLFNELGYKNKNLLDIVHNYHLSSKKTIEEFRNTFNIMKKNLNLKCDFNYFIDRYKYYFDKVDYYVNVRDFEHSLKNKCYIGIFSNLNILDKERIDKQVILNKYDYLFLSFEMGMVKPNKNAYMYIQNKVPFLKQNILLIDDKENNINMAKSIGWNAEKVNGLELEKIKKVCEDFLEL